MANAFEDGERKVIPATLVYVFNRGRVLMIHRDAAERSRDYHAGKWNGLGGKLDPDESPLEGARRELREESGIDLPESSFRALGALQFPNFKPHRAEDWIAFVFAAELDDDGRADAVPESSGEGSLHWIPAGELLSLNLWPGDRHFLPYVRERRPFFGTIWYRGSDVIRHWVVGLAPPSRS